MAKRNSGASSSGRRGSSRNSSKRGSFPRKGKSAERPFKKSQNRNTFRAPSKDDEGSARHSKGNKSYGEKREGGTSRSGRSEKPYRPGRAGGSPRDNRSFRKTHGEEDRDKQRQPPEKRERTSGSKSTPPRREEYKKSPSYGLPYKKKPYKKRISYSPDEASPGHKGKRGKSDDLRTLTSRDARAGSKKLRRRQPTAREAQDLTAPAQATQIRLNRYIANSGVSSRREADELIAMGLISVNGKTITEMGYKVNPGDEVRYENKVLKAEKPVYILLNKPKGYLTTTDDPQERNTVMHLIGNAVKERIYPVGRLDRNTTGLLLLTNDGELADKLMHPSYNVRKIYKAELDKALTKADFQKITEGVSLEEGKAIVDDLAIISEDGKTVGVELHIGWNRVVRRIFEALGYEVIRLDRSVYAGLDKKDLGRGEWRFLKKEEIIHLKHFK